MKTTQPKFRLYKRTLLLENGDTFVLTCQRSAPSFNTLSTTIYVEGYFESNSGWQICLNGGGFNGLNIPDGYKTNDSKIFRAFEKVNLVEAAKYVARKTRKYSDSIYNDIDSETLQAINYVSAKYRRILQTLANTTVK